MRSKDAKDVAAGCALNASLASLVAHTVAEHVGRAPKSREVCEVIQLLFSVNPVRLELLERRQLWRTEPNGARLRYAALVRATWYVCSSKAGHARAAIASIKHRATPGWA